MPFDPTRPSARAITAADAPRPQTTDADGLLSIDGCPFPRVAADRIRQMSEQERAAWDAARFKCKSDPIYLSDVLQFDLVENPHRMMFAQFTPMRPGTTLAELDPVKKRRMVLWPRGHSKTVGLRVAMVQTILNFPNGRLCFLTGGDKLAKIQLAALKRVFEQPTPRFLELFPEFCLTSHQKKGSGEWSDSLDELGTQHDFTIPCRTNTVFAEPTFKISTAKQVKAGGHFDFLFVDDLVNETNIGSPTALDKCYTNFLTLVPLLEPVGYMMVTGTRYFFGDTYEQILDQAKVAGESSLWKFSVRDCWSTTCTVCNRPEVFHDRESAGAPGTPGYPCVGFVSDGVRTVLFPQVTTRDGRLFGFTLDILDKIKADIGEDMFAKQYENNPMSASQVTFTQELLNQQTIRDANLIPSYFLGKTFAVADLAESTSPDADESVIYICRAFQGQIYVYGCRFGKWGSAETVGQIIAAMHECRPHAFYIEKTLGAEHLDNLLKARMTQLSMPAMPFVWVKVARQKGAKNTRIGNIQEVFASKRLWLSASMPGFQKLIGQLLKWPRIKHDDMADALARCIEVPTYYEADVQPVQTSSWLQRLHDEANREPEDDGTNDGLHFSF